MGGEGARGGRDKSPGGRGKSPGGRGRPGGGAPLGSPRTSLAAVGWLYAPCTCLILQVSLRNRCDCKNVFNAPFKQRPTARTRSSAHHPEADSESLSAPSTPAGYSPSSPRLHPAMVPEGAAPGTQPCAGPVSPPRRGHLLWQTPCSERKTHVTIPVGASLFLGPAGGHPAPRRPAPRGAACGLHPRAFASSPPSPSAPTAGLVASSSPRPCQAVTSKEDQPGCTQMTEQQFSLVGTVSSNFLNMSVETVLLRVRIGSAQ